MASGVEVAPHQVFMRSLGSDFQPWNRKKERCTYLCGRYHLAGHQHYFMTNTKIPAKSLKEHDSGIVIAPTGASIGVPMSLVGVIAETDRVQDLEVMLTCHR